MTNLRTIILNTVAALILTVGAVILAVKPAQACDIICWPEWHEHCVVTPEGANCDSHLVWVCWIFCL